MANIQQKPPSGVSRTAMWKKIVSAKRRASAELEKRKVQMERMTELGIGGASAVGSGLIFAKFPQMKSLPVGQGVDTDLVVAAVLAGFGLTNNRMAPASLEIAKGVGYPALSRLGAEKLAPMFG